ncbi:hypothetical protein ACWJ7D_002079 [Cronobacter sakazakii]|uniref:Uncharacterized protein n=1 Tax=Cronobacter condimenti 1330 TaxID=1073999 RepID=K7ZZS2_9ENTR|nr:MULTISPECIES: hypothetical protein [Cronobacter]YP_006590020.1 Ren-like exclusion protein [Cronobacter phage phiES15]AFH14937.1 putative protein Ren [Cronobacter phage phiES15]AFJ98446.1 hypothetical protein ES15_0873 [Cronobacter sakazakii ES15]ALB63537.1 hypothetical protein AFK62_13950 [Cronobacter condimenti 1330]EIV2971705.1 hypothetical protein [Cronobacter sakazakii]EJT7705364.1 hypothetical protein [Cronobacter sakazakii]
MTASEAIKHYLLEHPSFTTEQIVNAYGVSLQSVQHAARRMEMNGELVAVRDWRRLIYSLPGDNTGESVNVIFDECRLSGAMRRVLCVYGAIPASSAFNARSA